MLANAIYFNAKWDRPFLSGTKDDEFNLLGGDRVTVPMMSRRASTNYAQGQGYQAVELAYKGGTVQMIVLLPDPVHRCRAVLAGFDVGLRIIRIHLPVR